MPGLKANIISSQHSLINEGKQQQHAKVGLKASRKGTSVRSDLI